MSPFGVRCARVSALLFVLAAFLLSGCSAQDGLFSGVIQPSIVPSLSQRGTLPVDRTFGFDGGRVALEVPIDRAVYSGSIGARKSAIFFGKSSPPDWVAGYYRAFISEKHQTAFYQTLADALHVVKTREGLDSSAYVELVTAMAQGLEYRTDPGNLAPKFPIETFGNGYGDCDDKTLLAAGILSRDGYDVAILVFSPEKHVALGIRAPGLDYKGTGYAYVEMTEPSLVGIAPEQLSGGIPLTSQPEVIRIGDGNRTYGAASQITFIERKLAAVRAAERSLRTRIDADNRELDSQRASIEQERQSLSKIGDPSTLAAAVSRFNQNVAAYNRLADSANALVAKYNRLLDVEEYVAASQTARRQVYARLRTVSL